MPHAPGFSAAWKGTGHATEQERPHRADHGSVSYRLGSHAGDTLIPTARYPEVGPPPWLPAPTRSGPCGGKCELKKPCRPEERPINRRAMRVRERVKARACHRETAQRPFAIGRRVSQKGCFKLVPRGKWNDWHQGPGVVSHLSPPVIAFPRHGAEHQSVPCLPTQASYVQRHHSSVNGNRCCFGSTIGRWGDTL